MCVITGICGGALGLLGIIIAMVGGGATCMGLGGISCVAVCGATAFSVTMVCMLAIGAVLSVFGVSLADIMVGGACSGYLGYFGTFIEQGGNLYDALRICVAGK